MVPLDTLLGFGTVSLLLAVSPGTDNIFVLTQSARLGRWAGVSVTAGLCTGLLVHTAAVIAGVAALLQTVPSAFHGLRLIGAAYLLYLAWQAFKADPAPTDPCTVKTDRGLQWSLYRQGIIMNVTNPKVSIFFLALLPQFTDPARGSVSIQLLVLGMVFILATILVFGTVAVMAGSVARWLHHSPRRQILLNRIAGVIFVGIALELAIMHPS